VNVTKDSEHDPTETRKSGRRLRRVVIKTTKHGAKKKQLMDGDEEFELFSKCGDGYEMDGKLLFTGFLCTLFSFVLFIIPFSQGMQRFWLLNTYILYKGLMQQYYVHGVMRDSRNKDDRVSLVFRDGDLLVQDTDSGSECLNLSSRTSDPYYFGRNLRQLREGLQYSRHALWLGRFHR
jgi:hypothetical protein